jgi:hypothetical protein
MIEFLAIAAAVASAASLILHAVSKFSGNKTVLTVEEVVDEVLKFLGQSTGDVPAPAGIVGVAVPQVSPSAAK